MFWTVTQSLFDALGQTAEIFFLTLLFGLPLGLVVAFGSMSKCGKTAAPPRRRPTWPP